jgi:hypothetical protein
MNIDKAINKILWGRALVKAAGSDGVEKTFTLRSLTLKEQNEIEFLRETIMEECKEEGILLEEEMLEFLHDATAWTYVEEDRIVELEREIRKLKHGLKQSEFNATKTRMLRRKLTKTEKEIGELLYNKSQFLSLTAESRAEELVRRYMIFMSATDKFGNQTWQTEDDFLASTDSQLVDMLTIRYIESHIMSEKDVREVARSGMWRFRWAASKNGESLYGKPVSEWSDLQNNLVYWSQFYDYVYESLERPSQSIIDNDAALDAWSIEQNEGSSNKAKKEKKTAGSHQEQFIIVPDGDQGTIDKVNGMNSRQTKEQVSRERKLIKEKGKVSEWDLRKKGQ